MQPPPTVQFEVADSCPRAGAVPSRRGKAPPVDTFTGENVRIRLDDWLPTLKRASTWNGWTEEECLIQLAGQLHSRAIQEWNLLEDGNKRTNADATQALHSRMDRGCRGLAAQDFRHTVQGDAESISDFVRHLKHTFQIAYSQDSMSIETRDTLLHSQLQEWLRYDLMRAPAVSGAQTYKELCLATKNKESRLAELQKQQHYSMTQVPSAQQYQPIKQSGIKKCYCICDKPGHLARDCKAGKSESQGRLVPSTKQVRAIQGAGTSSGGPNPMDFLLSDSSEDDGRVRVVRVNNGGSQHKCVRLRIQGVPVVRILDSGADITITGGELFKKVQQQS